MKRYAIHITHVHNTHAYTHAYSTHKVKEAERVASTAKANAAKATAAVMKVEQQAAALTTIEKKTGRNPRSKTLRFAGVKGGGVFTQEMLDTVNFQDYEENFNNIFLKSYAVHAHELLGTEDMHKFRHEYQEEVSAFVFDPPWGITKQKHDKLIPKPDVDKLCAWMHTILDEDGVVLIRSNNNPSVQSTWSEALQKAGFIVDKSTLQVVLQQSTIK